MSVKVIIDGTGRHRGVRAWRGLRSSVGGILVLSGLVASVPAFVLGVYAIISAFTSGGAFGATAEPGRTQLTQGLTVSVVVTILGLILGVQLLRGRRRLVLFLRRFGYVETSQVVTAAARSVGRHWRLVTLDDDQLAPLGSGAGRPLERVSKGTDAFFEGIGRIGKLAAYAAMAAGAGAVIALVLALQYGGDPVQIVLESQTTEAQAVRALAVVAVVCLAIKIALSIVEGVGILALPLLIPTMFVSSLYDAVREADQAKSTAIQNPAVLEATAQSIATYRKRVFAPRLIVLRVRTAIWQQAVTRLATAADVVLVDVSEPTENLLWEIEELVHKRALKHVFICHHLRLSGLFDETDLAPLTRRLRDLLGGADVVAYEVDRNGTKKFTRALRDSLESQGSTVR